MEHVFHILRVRPNDRLEFIGNAQTDRIRRFGFIDRLLRQSTRYVIDFKVGQSCGEPHRSVRTGNDP